MVFEVGPVPVMTSIKPQRWNLSWLNPFDSDTGKGFNPFKKWFEGGKAVTAYISFENVEAEVILPTLTASQLKIGRA